MMSDINNEVIQEMIMVAQNKEKFNRFTTLNTRTPDTVKTIQDPDWTDKIRPARGFSTENWQSDIVDNINKRYDQFVNVSPAGGKSYPIQNDFWKKMVAKATSRDQIPKVLWVCENKTLASEVRNNFINIILDILVKKPVPNGYLEQLLNSMNLGHLNFNSGNHENLFIPTSQNISDLRRFAQSLTILRMQSSNEYITPNTIAASCTYKYAPQIINEFQPRIVVIDEIQERFTVTSGDPNNIIGKLKDLDDRVEYLIKTFKVLPSPNQCNVILLTGSMAHGTSEGIANYLNSKYKRMFVSVTTPSAANRASVSVIPYDDLTQKDGRRDDRAITDEIIKQIRSGQKYNLIAIFSQGSIKKICNNVINSTAKRSPEATVGIQNKIRIPESEKHIQTRVGRGTIAELAKKMESDPQELLNHLNKMLKGEKVQGVPTDPQLANALLHGIGYIMAEGREGGKITRSYNPADVKLVEILLAKGLIHTVLATTSVGVGVNLKIRNLYLPSIILPSGNEMKPMDASTLVQLINRAGRKDNMAATIYCSSQSFIRVMQYFGKGKYAGDPSQSVPIIPFSNISGSLYGSDIKSRFNRSLNPMATMRLILQMLS